MPNADATIGPLVVAYDRGLLEPNLDRWQIGYKRIDRCRVLDHEDFLAGVWRN
jgi:hypothetical protein